MPIIKHPKGSSPQLGEKLYETKKMELDERAARARAKNPSAAGTADKSVERYLKLKGYKKAR